MHHCYFFDNGEAQACSLDVLAGVANAIEAVKYSRQSLLGYADTGIGDPQDQVVGSSQSLDRDLTVLRREFDCIIDQVRNRRLNSARIFGCDAYPSIRVFESGVNCILSRCARALFVKV